MTFKSLLKTTALVAVAATIAGSGAFAANPLATTADVTIIGPITINEDAKVNFGKVVPPPSSFSDVTLTPAGAISATGGGVLLGGHSTGLYDFTGDVGSAYSIVYTLGVCGGTGLTLLAITDDKSAVLNDLDVNLGGTLRVDNTASSDPGAKSCPFTIAANY